MNSILYNTDSYKSSHFLQFPPGTDEMFYYIEPRIKKKRIRMFGLQMLLEKHLLDVPTRQDIREAADFYREHGEPFNINGWNKIANLGYFPLEINAVPEGAVVPTNNAVITIRNTRPHAIWLPGWVESLLMQIWYPTTACTISYECKKIIQWFLEKTGSPELIDFKLHDFGLRGCSCIEAAGIYGAAHLVNFKGTDNVPGIRALQEYYKLSSMPGYSIPASEHSTIISWGQEYEADAYSNLIKQFGKPGDIVACVSDSYSLSNAIEHIWCKQLKQQVLDSGCTLVVRPDSGNPSTVVVRTLQQLEVGFGTTLNQKGYKVLAPCIRIIQGDSIGSPADIADILTAVEKNGFSADNVTFGMGGGLAQKYDRDTYMWAMKNSAVRKNGTWYDVCKCPEDAPWKTSKKGILDLTTDFRTIDRRYELAYTSVLHTVFKNGVLSTEDFSTIRNRA